MTENDYKTNKTPKTSRLDEMNALKKRLDEMMFSPEAKMRQAWRETQREALREMGMTAEVIEEEILI